MSNDTCMNADDNCAGSLNVTRSRMGSRLVRCDFHQRRRDEIEKDIQELESPTAPAWFDPQNAGETWGDEGLE